MITIAIGANLDIQNVSSKYETCLKALQLLKTDFNCEIIKTSDWYQTTAWPNTSDPPYINGAAIVRPNISSPHIFLSQLHHIELQLGRQRNKRWEARTIDLDLLTWNDFITKNTNCLKGLTLPHPRLHERYFVLLPLTQIAPQLVIPGLAQTVQSVFNQLKYNEQDISLFKKASDFF